MKFTEDKFAAHMRPISGSAIREVFKLLTRPQGTPCDQGGLAARRKALGISQAQAAQATGLTKSKVGRLERLVEYHTESLGAYHAFLSEMELKLGLDNI